MFLGVILHTMWSGKSMLCILPFGILCLSAIRIIFVKKNIGEVYVGGYGCLSEARLCVFHKLCPVDYLVFGKCSSVLLKFSGVDVA